MAVLGQCVQVTGTDVQEGISGRGGRRQDDRVDDGRQGLDVRSVHSNDPWRLGGAFRTRGERLQQVCIVVWDQQPHGEGAEDVEEQDTPEDTADRLGDIASGIFGLTRGHCHGFHATISESGIDHDGPPAEESTFSSGGNVLVHRARVPPILETQSVLSWHAADVNDQGQDQQADQRDDLDRCKDELGFSVDGDSKDVQAEDEDDDDTDPRRHIDVLCSMPELNDGRGRRNLGTLRDGRVVPIVPADGKAKRVIGVSRGELRNGAGEGEPSGHFTQTGHHGEDHDAYDQVPEDDGQRARLRQGATETQEQAGSDGASQGNELDVTRLEAATPVSGRGVGTRRTTDPRWTYPYSSAVWTSPYISVASLTREPRRISCLFSSCSASGLSWPLAAYSSYGPFSSRWPLMMAAVRSYASTVGWEKRSRSCPADVRGQGKGCEDVRTRAIRERAGSVCGWSDGPAPLFEAGRKSGDRGGRGRGRW